MKKYIKRILNRPGGRLILSLIATLYTSLKQEMNFFWIFYKDGVWIHKHPDGVIVDRKINFMDTLANFESMTKDIWGFIYQPKKNNVVIDVGAGIGTEVYYYSRIVGQNGKIVAIEAHPETYRCLCKFCQYNKLNNVVLVNMAIGADESEVLIGDNIKHVSSTIIGTKTGRRVKCIPLDLLMENLKIPRIDFLKMNIEGAEKYAIMGMSESIKKIKYICISCHDFKADSEGMAAMRTYNIVKKFLIKNNFEIISREHDHRPNIRDQLNGINRFLP